MKSVLFINRVYPPDEGATGQLLAELVEGLIREGWTVTVVAAGGAPRGQPTRSDGTNSQSMADSSLRSNGFVHRVRSLPFTRSALWKRAFSYASLYPAIFWRVMRLPRHDVVVTLTDPPMQLTLGPLIKLFKRSRLVHWAQDLYPEVAEELKVLRRKGAVASTLRRASTWSLQRYDAIVAVGSCMKTRFKQRGFDDLQITVIPNWSLAQNGDAPPDASGFRKAHRWEDRFVVMYSGNLGLAHPFKGIIHAIHSLRVRQPGILFVLVGQGPQLAAVREKLGDADNVQLLPHQPIASLATSLRAADVHLATMFERTCGLVVPSKVYGIITAERPCVFLGPGESEGARLLMKNGCGVVLPSWDGEALANLLVEWSEKPSLMNLMRENARRVAPQLGLRPALLAFQQVLAPKEGT